MTSGQPRSGRRPTIHRLRPAAADAIGRSSGVESIGAIRVRATLSRPTDRSINYIAEFSFVRPEFGTSPGPTGGEVTRHDRRATSHE